MKLYHYVFTASCYLFLALPLITFLYLHFLDYYTTLWGFRHGAYELDKFASSLLAQGDVAELLYYKSLHILLVVLIYAVGLYLVSTRDESDDLYAVGVALLLGFAVAYFVILYAVLGNIFEILQAL